MHFDLVDGKRDSPNHENRYADSLNNAVRLSQHQSCRSIIGHMVGDRNLSRLGRGRNIIRHIDRGAVVLMRRALRALAVATVVFAGSTLASPVQAQADVASSFRAGNIISDDVFYDSSTMNAAAVQAFLNARNAGCNSGFICIKDYRETTPTRAAEAGLCTGYLGASNELAATIISKVAQSCKINPQVLLVLLQKESGLITSKSPSYQTATGFGCPDTAACNTSYYGFFNQVYLAARQFRLYRLNPTNYGYVAGRSNFVLYHPNSACGGTSVYIDNQATAGLYNYTPYQPNTAALAALRSTGDACSSYGNRNFWVFFQDWFGSTSQRGTALIGVDMAGDLRYYRNSFIASGGTAPYTSGSIVGSNFGQYRLISAGDIDCDGTRDLVAISPDGALWYSRGEAKPETDAVQYAPPVQIGSGWTAFDRLAVGDVDGDCRADIIATMDDGTLWSYINGMTVNPGGMPYSSGARIGAGWTPFDRLLLADLDGNRFADILARGVDGSLWYYQNGLASNSRQPPYGPQALLGTGWSVYTQLIATDVTGDGFADLLGVDADGGLWLYRNRVFGPPYDSRTQIGSGWSVFSRVL